MRGKFILVIGPSGSGKGALLSYVKEHRPDIIFPVSCTTRSPRPGEVEGETYHFLSNEAFDEKVAKGEFLEWASYGGNRYGTLKSEIMDALENGKTVMREVEVQGARQIKNIFLADHLRVVFIDAGPWEDLERRIVSRAAISLEELTKRKERYSDERTFMLDAFAVVRNFDGKLEEAQKHFLEAVEKAEV